MLLPNPRTLGSPGLYNALVRRRLNQYIITEILGPPGLGLLVHSSIAFKFFSKNDMPPH